MLNIHSFQKTYRFVLVGLLAVLLLALGLALTVTADDHTLHTYNGTSMPLDNVYAPDEVEVVFGNAPATCLDASGKGSFTCDDCGLEYLVSIKGKCVYRVSASVDATCSSAGSKTYKCQVCGDEYTEAISLKDHDYTGVAPTITGPSAATNNKVILGFDCNNCAHVKTIECDSYTTNYTPSTCAAAGSTRYTYCYTEGGSVKVGEFVVPEVRPAHYYDNGTEVEIDLKKIYSLAELKVIFGDDLADLTIFGNVFTDCTTAGQVAFICSGCGIEYLFTATGDHVWSESGRTPATCTTAGTISYVCSKDATHTTAETNVTLPAIGHNYVMDENASDLTTGKLVFVCANDATHTQEINATWYNIVDNKATCLAGGSRYIEYKHIDPNTGVESEVKTATLQTYEKNNLHTFGATTTIDLYKNYSISELKAIFGNQLTGLIFYGNFPTTCQADVPASFVCDVCSQDFLILHIRGDHDLRETGKVSGTCAVPGEVFYACSTHGCDYETAAEKFEIAPQRHHFGEFIVSSGDFYRMSELKEIFGEDLDGLSLSAVPSDCRSQVSASFTCSGCQSSVTISASADHVCNVEKVTSWALCTPATCTVAATYYKTCACGLMRGEETFSYGDVLPHTYDKKVAEEEYLVSPATCTSAETYLKSCVCGLAGSETFTYGNPLPHTYDQEKPEDRYFRSRATCTAAATYYKSCACGAMGWSTFSYGDILPHTYDKNVAEEAYFASSATCTAAATYYKSCVCGLKGSETFSHGNPIPHTFDCLIAAEQYLKSPATLTDSAVYYKSCTCGAKGTTTFSYGEPLPKPDTPHTHSFERTLAAEVYLCTPASCTAVATYYKSCTCGEKGTGTFSYGDTLAHTFDKTSAAEQYLAAPATCTAAATYYKSCACGEKGSETFSYGGSLTHSFDRELATEQYFAAPATCTVAATYYKSCTCGEKGTDTFFFGDALEHSFGRELATEQYLATPASCTAGATYYKSCTCGEKGSETFVYGEPAHSFDCLIAAERYLKTPATTTDCAVYYKSCICGEKGTSTFSYGEPLPENPPAGDDNPPAGDDTPPAGDTPATGGCGGSLDGAWVILLGLAVVVTVKARKRKEN